MAEFDRRWVVAAALLLAACSDPDRVVATTDSGTVDTGTGDASDTGTGDTGKPDTGVVDTGTTETGETGPLVKPTTAFSLVPGGARMVDDKYILVTNTSPITGSHLSSSSSYVLHGGVIGAVESSQ